jgi:hypothetical protein
MSYSIAQITSASECDLLIELGVESKSELLQDLQILEIQRDNATKIADTVNKELVVKQAELNAVDTVIASIEGSIKKEYTGKKTRLENRIRILNLRKEEAGALKLIKIQLEIARVLAEIATIDDFSAQVNQRKTELS